MYVRCTKYLLSTAYWEIVILGLFFAGLSSGLRNTDMYVYRRTVTVYVCFLSFKEARQIFFGN